MAYRRGVSGLVQALGVLCLVAQVVSGQANVATTAASTATATATPSSSSAMTTASSTNSGSASSTQSSSITTTGSTTTSGSSTTGTGSSSTDSTPSTTYDTAIPTYPAPTVPSTADSPFMKHSTAPEGTVFIAVGAILGAAGLAILFYRFLLGWLLHRSVERATRQQYSSLDKAGFPAPPAPFYKYSDNMGAGDSSPDSSARSHARKVSKRPNIPSTTPSQTNLFFSPTARGGGASSSGGGGGNGYQSDRESRYLPSGFYAASSSTPSAGGSYGPSHARGTSISMSTLQPESKRHSSRPRSVPSAALESPSARGRPPQSGQRHRTDRSTSTARKNPSSRPQSAYMDDMVDDAPDRYRSGKSRSGSVGQYPPSSGQRYSRAERDQWH